MKNGYKILWTNNALKELQKTIQHLEENWTQKELRNLAINLEKTLNLISQNPYIFQVSDEINNVRRVIILKLNTMYYKVYENKVVILSFFSNRQNPKNRKLK